MGSHCRHDNARIEKLAAIWLLFGGKAGDNAQVQALGSELAAQTGWDYKVKQLRHHPAELLMHLRSKPTLLGITPASRSVFAAPWPEVVISAGRRNELVALWIRQQSPQTRVIHIGRPWCHPDRFDLVVATPQYQLEGFANVLVNRLPLHQVDGESVASAREAWRGRLADLPSPRTVLLLGGNSGTYVLGATQAVQIARSLEAFSDGGLVVSTSRRTPPGFIDALLEHIRAPDMVYRWGESPDNPYLGLLAWGDRFIVTEDSVSMTAEAIATGKEVFIAALEPVRPWWSGLSSFGWKPLTHRLAMALAPARFHRNVRRMHEQLVAEGLVHWLALPGRDSPREPQSGQPTHPDFDPGQDLQRSVAAVRALLPGQNG